MQGPDISRWTCIYTSYLNSKVPQSLGRRVNKGVAVENPKAQEISEVLQFLKLPHCIENKAFPRDILDRGRVRVMLKNESNEFNNPEVTSKRVLLNKLCEFIPRLKSRATTEETKAPVKDKRKKKRKK
mmetsp:Transcript_7354/g.10865  ORF Transcript_7354/g.10865 Transcript_7354/m.10865 type:complete len:128 (-) Transcript_7354:426-809(-)